MHQPEWGHPLGVEHRLSSDAAFQDSRHTGPGLWGLVVEKYGYSNVSYRISLLLG